MKILLNDNSYEIDSPVTGHELVADKRVFSGNKRTCVGISVNGETKNLTDIVREGDTVELLTFENPQGQYMFWHTSAHVLAQAILRLYPDARPAIGPPIENGFYYDFGNLHITEDDFKTIENEIKKILKADYATKRIDYNGKQDALDVFGDNPYKRELIGNLEEGLTAYSQGEFTDLCRGPHIPSVGYIRAFKILKTSGAYWRADQKNDQLTRIYAISYPDKKQLADYLHLVAEAKKRDHRVLGKKLDIFSFQHAAPGMPFFHPPGLIIWKKLMAFWYEKHLAAGYSEIKTPILLSQDLWKQSGHWDNYRENMYTTEMDDRSYSIKPMNCPGCMLFFKSGQYSYRQLPLRIAEVGHVHRHELSGALSGLFRVRGFHQDDSHLFMQEKDIEREIIGIIHLAKDIYSAFNLDFEMELSTRPKKSIGTDKQWEITTNGLLNALKNNHIDYKLNEGDGAFYGPKIDLHIKDAIGRTWQCGTIQLDMMLPEKFDLTYDDEHGKKARPIMLHRTIFGSVERFLGILIEHYSGRFPLWISPRQIVILPVADRHVDYARTLCAQFEADGFICAVDESTESVSKKIRTAQMLQHNYMVIIGDNELEAKNLSVRTRDGKQLNNVEYRSLAETLGEELRLRRTDSPL